MDKIRQLTAQLSAHPHFQQVVNSPVAQKSLGTIVALGLLRYVNNSLSQWAVNNWRYDSWQGDKELVLVTGGASGIGRQIMEDLARAGVRVVIVDIQEPDFKLRTSCYPGGDGPMSRNAR